tara:strand:- start:173 stop:547 length:375 start_codon:yes stop_codon:yes gene_type:complete
MNSPTNDLRTLFEKGSGDVEASPEFDQRLSEGIAQRRRRRFGMSAGALMLIFFLSVFQWPQTDDGPRADDGAWVASLEQLWFEHEEELDELLDDSEWTDSDEWPSNYGVFAQLIDETEDQEAIQ